jgi:hypothetical protein
MLIKKLDWLLRYKSSLMSNEYLIINRFVVYFAYIDKCKYVIKFKNLKSYNDVVNLSHFFVYVARYLHSDFNKCDHHLF